MTKNSAPIADPTRLPPETIATYISDDRRYVAQTSPAEKSMVVTRTSGCSVYTADGRQYLDFIAGIAVNNVGHTHPEIRAAVAAQLEQMLHVNVFGKFVIPAQVDLGRALAEVTPAGLEQTFFTNSGAEAIEGALKLARKYTGRSKIIAFEMGFHGRTLGALSVSWRDIYRRPFEPLLPDVSFIPFNDLAAAEAAIDQATAAVIVEPIQGEGGVRVPHDDFLPGLRALCDRHGALLILDEVQTGFGRTGRLFACEHWGVSPDILVMAKGLGGGMPIGGFISRPEVMVTFVDPPLSHLTTFGGHPLSCAAALANLRLIERDGLVDRAARAGRYLQDRLAELQQRNDLIAEVRGKGLMIGLELAEADLTRAFVQRALDLGLILGWTIYSGVTVRLAPPLIVSDQELEQGLAIIEQALAETRSSR
ncbi:MAG TPA: aspartate aminotransferase family protein [Anaerolineae bacterium]|nr:aspartate aminotransferase family protein [Anaerolineae bacterium]